MSQNGGVSNGDPTSVVGRRVAAFLIDAIIFNVLMSIVLFVALSPDTVSGNVCEDFDGATENINLFFDGSSLCFYDGSNSQIWDVTGPGALAIYGLPTLYVILAFWVLQGLTGASPGKFAVGLRVVKADGRACGVGRAALRNLLFVVDALPYCIPYLVGFLMILFQRQHRRIGDLAAGTWVIRSSSLGMPMAASAGAAPGGWSGTAPGAPPTAGGWTNPSAPPTVGAGSSNPPMGAPDGQGTPQWDAARNAWIQYSPGQGRWLQHEPASGQWRGI